MDQLDWGISSLLPSLATLVLRVIPDFGPMRKAEYRAATTGQLLRPGAKPLLVALLTAGLYLWI